jgi:hypothetical protein
MVFRSHASSMEMKCKSDLSNIMLTIFWPAPTNMNQSEQRIKECFERYLSTLF